MNIHRSKGTGAYTLTYIQRGVLRVKYVITYVPDLPRNSSRDAGYKLGVIAKVGTKKDCEDFLCSLGDTVFYSYCDRGYRCISSPARS